MKKIAMLAAGMLLGMNVYGAALDTVPVASAEVENAVKSMDDSIFKVVQPMKEYRIGKYDVMELMALGFPDGLGIDEITVGADGMVRLPYNVNIHVVGCTLDEARDMIYAQLSQYYKLPELNVYLKSYGARKVYVVGNVIEPGIKEMNVDNMNVYAAVASAGGVDNRGRAKHIQLIRQIDGVISYREINLDAVVKKHDMSQNIALEDGDIVYVPDSGKVVFSEDIAPYINIYATYRALTRD